MKSPVFSSLGHTENAADTPGIEAHGWKLRLGDPMKFLITSAILAFLATGPSLLDPDVSSAQSPTAAPEGAAVHLSSGPEIISAELNFGPIIEPHG